MSIFFQCRRFCLVFNPFFLLLLIFTREFHVAHVYKRISCFQHSHLWFKKKCRVKRTLSSIYLLDMFCVFFFFFCFILFLLQGTKIHLVWIGNISSLTGSSPILEVFVLFFYFNNTQQSHAESLWALLEVWLWPVSYLTGYPTSPLQSLTSASKCKKSPLFSLDLIWMYTTFNSLH